MLVRFVGLRILRIIVSLFVVSIITFFLLQMAPGDFAGIQSLGGASTGLASQQVGNSQGQLQDIYGADIPVLGQYWNWLSGAIHGDFGPSYKYPGSSVGQIIGQALPISATLATIAMLLALVVSVPMGLFAASKKNNTVDHATMLAATLGVAIPNYLAAIVMVLIFSLGLHLLPTGGWDGPENAVMPVLALAVAPAGVMARYVRSSVLEVLREEYVVAAAARGGTRRTVLVRHVLRNSLIPLVTVAGPSLAGLMVGTIFVETIFGIPGLGRYFTEAALGRDMPLLMGATMIFALVLMLMNLVVDLTYAVLDPRTRLGLGLTEVRSGRSSKGAAQVASTEVIAGGPMSLIGAPPTLSAPEEETDGRR